MTCKECKGELSFNEIGLNKKLISRAVSEFYCKKCLAKKFKVTEQDLDEKIKQFIDAGCSLFVKQ